MSNVRKYYRRRKPKPLFPSALAAFATIELADVAMKKLFHDEPLTTEELDALLHSEYLSPSEDGAAGQAAGAQTLYQPSRLGIAISSPFLFTDVEREVLAYFGRHPEVLHSLPPRKFEELVAAVFRQSGFDVELTPETRDGGIDIIAVRKDSLLGEGLHLVECKRYIPGNTVGIGVVQRLLGVVEQHRATKGIIVTTSTFTRDALEVAQNARHRLALNEYSTLAHWLAQFSRRAP